MSRLSSAGSGSEGVSGSGSGSGGGLKICDVRGACVAFLQVLSNIAEDLALVFVRECVPSDLCLFG